MKGCLGKAALDFLEAKTMKTPMYSEDTICALATPPGEGGIGIIRISGEKSKEILGDIFSFGKREMVNRELTYGHIVDPDTSEEIDEAMAVFLPSPHTYTREDMVEIDCHGGSVTIRRVLELIISQGARMAEPGEFTKRAFMNGRIDLAQAEAVMVVVSARSDMASKAALSQLRGKFSQEIQDLRREMVDALVNIDVNIDYPDEDIEYITYDGLDKAIRSSLEKVEDLIGGAKAGKVIRDGIDVAIIGRPNVGKSSLLNGLLKEERAIVTEIPGTTRDTIQEYANIGGIIFRFTDTAGIRETLDPVEKLGIERSLSSKESAEIVLCLVDGSEEITEEDKNLIRGLNPKKDILVINKEDKGLKYSPKELMEILGDLEEECLEKETISPIVLSVREKEGIREIEKKLLEKSSLGIEKMNKDMVVVTNARHLESLKNAEKSLKEALEGIKTKDPLELIEIDVREAYEQLGFITGDSVQDDVIEEVFKRFCLGK